MHRKIACANALRDRKRVRRNGSATTRIVSCRRKIEKTALQPKTFRRISRKPSSGTSWEGNSRTALSMISSTRDEAEGGGAAVKNRKMTRRMPSIFLGPDRNHAHAAGTWFQSAVACPGSLYLFRS